MAKHAWYSLMGIQQPLKSVRLPGQAPHRHIRTSKVTGVQRAWRSSMLASSSHTPKVPLANSTERRADAAAAELGPPRARLSAAGGANRIRRTAPCSVQGLYCYTTFRSKDSTSACQPSRSRRRTAFCSVQLV